MSERRLAPLPKVPPKVSLPVSVSQMQAIDRATIEQIGIPRLLLIDHAGLALANAIEQHFSHPKHPVLILCGTGYNGGDGLSAARHLNARSRSVRVLLAGKRSALRDEPALFARILEKLGVSCGEIADPLDSHRVDEELARAGVVIDALLGIGLREEVREPMRTLIERLNACGKPVVAADIPSGLEADTGKPLGVCVRALLTVTFGRLKQGCLRNEGPLYCGKIELEPIGFPPQVLWGSSGNHVGSG